MGLGVYGRINSASLRYQAYIMNGFISYNGAYKLKGTNGVILEIFNLNSLEKYLNDN